MYTIKDIINKYMFYFKQKGGESMLNKILKTNMIKKSVIEEEFGLSKSHINKIIAMQSYKEPSFYKRLYEIIYEQGTFTHQNPPLMIGEVYLVPMSIAKGVFGVYINDAFIIALRFTNLEDCYRFLRGEDNRLEPIKALGTYTEIDNFVK